MTIEDRKDLARLLFQQCHATAADIAQRAIGDRVLTDVAIADIKRTLQHMIRSIDEREENAAG